MKRATFILWTGVVSPLLLCSETSASDWCHPRDNTARVLKSHNPNDIHPDWTGENYLGTSWALAPGQRVDVDGITYIKGSLYSPRGGLVNEGIYVLAREWICD